MSNILKLYGLQASSKNSVVSQTKLSDLQDNLYIRSDIDNFIINYCLDGMENQQTKLIILSGNAGDGKSMTLYKITEALVEKGVPKEKLVINADATQTDSPDDKLEVKLKYFFENFIIDHQENNSKIYLIAMNVGIAIRFFNSTYFEYNEDEENEFTFLKNFIFNELSIENLKEFQSQYYEKYSKDILIANFDLRTLVKPNFASEDGEISNSFFKRMLEKIFELVDLDKCLSCGKSSCPIYFNLLAVKSEYISSKLENMLFKVFLYNKVHLTPRNVWDFIYHVVTGGETKYIETFGHSNKDLSNPCDIFNSVSIDDYSKFLFYNNLFDDYSDNAILSFINENIEKFDPVYSNNKELELLKILASSNRDYFMDIVKEKSNYLLLREFNNNELIEKMFDVNSGESIDLVKNICRFMYFFYEKENEIPDVLITNPMQTMNESYFKEFYDCLQIEKDAVLGIENRNFEPSILTMIRDVLLKTLGSQIGRQQIIQLNTVSTRGKGKLLDQIKISINNGHNNTTTLRNTNVMKALNYFPNSFKLRINEVNLFEVGLDLFELIVLSHSGYNINSVDLELFNQFEVLRKSLVSNKASSDSIFYEYNQQYFMLEKDIIMEFKKIK